MEQEELNQAPEQACILVVEDDQDTANFLRDLLTEAGHHVVVARDGATALKAINSEPPDVVLMDLMLPGMDGYAVTQKIRSSTLASVPIIMVTAADQTSSKIRGFDAGVDDFVIKPFSGPELLARIAAQVRRGHTLRILEDQSAFLSRTLEAVAHRQKEAETSFELERSMRNDLLRSVNTHLQSLVTVFDSEHRRQPPGPGREALQRVIPRLRSAALVYQISEALTRETADFGSLLRTIATSLKQVYSPRKRIPLTLDVVNVEIPSSIASPLAMVATELITNSFKHAFPHSRFGAIAVICGVDDGTLRLEVVDDGVGMEGREVGASRGLAAVVKLVGDLGGTLRPSSSEQGTRMEVRVPLPAAAAAA